jgi:hypothetical protein
MGKTSVKILFLIIISITCFALVACGNLSPGNNTQDTGGGSEEQEENLHADEIAFIENNVANFTFVFASDVSGDLRSNVYDLIDRLRAMGVTVSEPVNHTDASVVSECEIIIGTGVKGRDGKYSVNPYDLGDDGYVVKVIDKKLVIAGGTVAMTEEAFDYFVEQVLCITDETASFESLYVKKDFENLQLTEYPITSVKIGERELSEYTIILDIEEASAFNTDDIRYFKRNLYRKTGYSLEVTDIYKASK